MVTIKTKEQIEIMKKAGHLNYLTHQYLKGLIAPGVSTKYLNDEADKFIRENGGIPGFLNYEGYPASICISVNDEVVHGIPSENCILKNGDIVSLDIGVVIDGYHSDSAWTYPVGDVNKEKERLMHHTEKALYIGLAEIKNGAHLNNIGARISEYAHKHKLGVIKELVGHGVGADLHEDPDVPNYGKYNTGMILKTGMVIAVEPMLTAGRRHIAILDDDWTIVTRDGSPSAHFEHTVLVLDDGYEILTGE
jgi:methionyl aminopeptidase